MVLMGAIVALILVGGAECHTSCSKEENSSMQMRFNLCRSQYRGDSKGMAEGERDSVCHRLEKGVRDCMNVLQECHTHTEIQGMEDMLVEAMVAQWSGEGARSCPWYIQYRLRQAHYEETTAPCTDVESNAAMNEFQNCSRHITTAAYQIVLDMTTPPEMAMVLCQALANISATCPSLLTTCFAAEDVEQMKSLHMQEMRDFLLMIAKNRVAARDIDKCGQGEDIEVEPQLPTTRQNRPSTTTRYIERETSSITSERMSTTTTTIRTLERMSTATTTIRTSIPTAPPVTSAVPVTARRPYDDYYGYDEDGDNKDDINEAKQPQHPVEHSSRRQAPMKEAVTVTIRGDDEGHWGGGRGQARTLAAGGSASHWPSRSNVMIWGLGLVVLLRAL